MKAFNQFRKMQGIGATRIRLGMTQTAFAEALEISRSLLALVETGKRTMPTLALCKLAAMEIKIAAQETLDCMAASSPADPALNSRQNHHLEILNCKIMKCRMTAAKKECWISVGPGCGTGGRRSEKKNFTRRSFMITKLKLYHNQLKLYIMPKRIKPRRPYWLHDVKTDQYYMEMRPCTTRDLYKFYHMSRTAFETMIDPLAEVLGERGGHYFTVRQLEHIYDYVGPPYVGIIKWNEF